MNREEKIESYIKRAENFLGKNKTRSDSEFQAWNNAVIRFIENVYGDNSTTYYNFKKRSYTLSIFLSNTPKYEFVKAFEDDLKITIADLKEILNEIKENPNIDKKMKSNEEKSSIVINNNITNYQMNLNDIKTIIEDNTMLGDKDKEILLKYLDDLKELQKSKKSKNEKWKVIKEILRFVVDKGADIAIMFLPQIIKALQS